MAYPGARGANRATARSREAQPLTRSAEWCVWRPGAGIPASEREEDPMGRDEKMDHKLEELRGKVKDAFRRR